MDILIAPFIITGLVLKVYNHSKSNLFKQNKVTNNQHANISRKQTTDLGIYSHEQQRQKDTISV